MHDTPSRSSASPSRHLIALPLLSLLLCALPLSGVASAQSPQVRLTVSDVPDRGSPVGLAGRTLWGAVYVTAAVPAATARVHFHLDDPDLRRLPTRTEHAAPHDLMGGSETRANPWDTRSLPSGDHVLVAVAVMADGTRVTSSPTAFRIEQPGQPASGHAEVPATDLAQGGDSPVDGDSSGAAPGATASGGATVVAQPSADPQPVAPPAGQPTTQQPTTQQPTTQQPITQPPVTQPPAGQPVATFPSAQSTGPRHGVALTRVDGGVVRQDGAVLEGLDIQGCLLIDADHVVVRDVRISCHDGHGISFAEGTTGGLVEHARLLGSGRGVDAGVHGGHGITVRHTDISGFEDGLKGAPASRYEANYVHDLNTATPGHNDGLQLMQGHDVQIIGNTFDLVVAQDVNAGVWIKQDKGPIDGVLIQGNLFSGAGYHVKVGNGRGVVAIDNVHADVFRWGVYDGPMSVSGARTVDGRSLR